MGLLFLQANYTHLRNQKSRVVRSETFVRIAPTFDVGGGARDAENARRTGFPPRDAALRSGVPRVWQISPFRFAFARRRDPHGDGITRAIPTKSMRTRGADGFARIKKARREKGAARLFNYQLPFTNYFVSIGLDVVCNSLISPVTTKTVRSQMLVTRSAMELGTIERQRSSRHHTDIRKSLCIQPHPI